MKMKNKISAKIRFRTRFAVLLALLAGQPVASGEYWVSATGNDASPGTKEKPFGTLQRARDAVRELKRGQEGVLSQPVRVVLRRGVYYLGEPLRLTTLDGGSEKCPVTYAVYGSEKAVISGGYPIRDWRQVELNGRAVWAADLPEVREGKLFFHQLWINGQRLPRARHPKKGYLKVASIPRRAESWTEGGNRFCFQEGDIGTWAVGGDTEVVVMSRWVESRLPVVRVDEGEHTAYFGKRSVFRLDAGDLYYAEHARSLLEAPGEWYLDRKAGVLYVVPLPGVTPDTFVAVAPVLQDVVRIEGEPTRNKWVEHVAFRGLTFAHTEWYFPPGSNMVGLRPEVTTDEPYLRADVGGCPQAAVRVPAAVVVSGARRIAFEGCTFTNVGGYAVAMERGCRHNHISRCEMTDLGAGGVKIGETLLRESNAEQTFGNEVIDCHIHNAGRIFHSAVGIWVGQSYKNRLANNHIHDLYYSGISIGWTWLYGKTLARENVVEYNHVHHLGKLSNGDGPILSDMGGVYTVGMPPGTAIRNNSFHDVAGFRYGGWGIYLDEGSSYILVENNLVTHTTHGGFHQHYGRENTVRNNIFAFGRFQQIYRSPKEPHLSFTFERNIVYWTEGRLTGTAWGNPKVVFDHNLYWNAGGGEVRFGDDLSFEEWQAKGLDQHSHIADPLFVDPEHGDFRLKPGSPAAKIRFEPWDMSAVGPVKNSEDVP